jgi:putative Mg2+ transporter-C (MgtC) family protein
MREISDCIAQEFEVASTAAVTRMLLRLLVAMILGGVIGFDRQWVGKAAGFRTHILVCFGTALFVIAGLETEMDANSLSRVVQGIVTGIGFLGGGVILKLREERQIKGVTTAATIWLTCAIGVAVGFGRYALATTATILGLIVIEVLRQLEPPHKPKES